jgi:hypothetical protein
MFLQPGASHPLATRGVVRRAATFPEVPDASLST